MKSFEYASPTTREEAVQLLAEEGVETAALAGGTDLFSLMKDGVESPGRLVNIKAVEGLGGVERLEDGGLRIGALVTLDELIANEHIRSAYPSLVQAGEGVRSSQLRAMGTVGGDLLQRPRCWYYRGGFGLLAQNDGRSRVVDGDNRYHAILGTKGPAYFVNPSSLAPALVALGARIHLHGRDGERGVDLGSFYRAPVRESEREYDLARAEILTEVVVPAAATSNACYEVRQKEALDWPLAAAAVSLQMEAGRVIKASVVLGHVAPTPYASKAAAAALEGGEITTQRAEEAGVAAVDGALALSRNGYKVQLAKVATKRAILRAAGLEV